MRSSLVILFVCGCVLLREELQLKILLEIVYFVACCCV